MKKKISKKSIFIWGITTAWKMGPSSILGWGVISIAAALLPVLSLFFQKQIFERLNQLVVNGEGKLQDVMLYLILLGICLIFMEISRQIDIQLIYQMNYDRYQTGISKRMMEFIQDVDQKTLMRKEINDRYRSANCKLHQLCAFMADIFLLITWCLRILLFLIIMAQYSALIFAVSILYLVFAYRISDRFSEHLIFDFAKNRTYVSRSQYYENCVLDLGVAKEIRTFHNTEKVIRGWKNEYEPIKNGEIRFARWSSIISLFCSFGYYILVFTILLYAIVQIKNGRMDISVFLILYETAREMSGSIQEFWDIRSHFKKTSFDIGELKKFWEQVPRMQSHAGQQPQTSEEEIVFEARNLCFSYDDENEVLHNLNFQIHKGETIALVGLNGSGKSTLTKLLIGQFTPTKGELLYRGKACKEYPGESITDDIGIFFQDYQIVHGTLKENVGISDWKNMEDIEKIQDAVKRGRAEELVKKLPDGLETWLMRDVKKNGVNLSGGEQQKVAISRAYMSERPILIFDEPGSSLDPIAEMEQFQVIQKQLEGKTGILISHRVGFARMADRIFVLEQGQLVETGNHEELMSKNGVYANFFHKQADWYQQKS